MYVKIQMDPVFSKTFLQVKGLPGCFFSSYEKVWYDKTKNFADEAKNFIKWISCRQRLTVTEKFWPSEFRRDSSNECQELVYPNSRLAEFGSITTSLPAGTSEEHILFGDVTIDFLNKARTFANSIPDGKFVYLLSILQHRKRQASRMDYI
ncbi:unnamed protein product [Caenorhabditis brenneri]